MSPTVTEVILHCQKQIKKDQSNERLLHYIDRLSRLRIGTDDLISTGIGRTVNQLSRMDGVVGEKAYNLVTHWKALVKAERSSESSAESDSASSSEGEDVADHGIVPHENEEIISRPPPKIVVNGLRQIGDRKEVEDDEDSSALPSFVNYSRNQDESDKESDSDHSDRLCIDDTPSVDSKKALQVQESEEEEETESEPTKFFPSSSSDESESEESDVEEKKQSKSHPKQDKNYAHHHKKTHSPSPTTKHEEKSHHHRSSDKHQGSSRDRDKVTKTFESKHQYRSDKVVVKVETKSRSPSRSRSRSPRGQTHFKHHHHHHHKVDQGKVTIKKERMSKSRSPPRSRSPPSSNNRKPVTKNGLLTVPNIAFKKEKEDSPFRSMTSSPSKSKESSTQSTPRPSPKGKDEKSDRERSRSEKREKTNSKDRKRRGDSADEQEEKDTKKQKVDLPKTPEKKLNSLDCLKPKLLPRLNVEIDSTSGINFSDVLSGLDSKKLKKASKKSSPLKSTSNSPSPLKTKQFETPSTSNSTPSRAVAKVSPFIHTPPPPSTSKILATEHLKILQDLDVGTREDRYWEDSNLALNGSYEQSDSDALSTMMSSRSQRTKVYSGVKTGTIGGKIPKLFDSCLRVVQENIFLLGYTGGIPYDILEPVIRRASLKELMHIELYNPYLIEYTDSVWKYHCKQNFRGRNPDEIETWRDLYSRCVNEQTARFKSLTKKLKNKLEDATPLRKAKLAYVETHAGPKFNKSKAATIKTGMSSLKTREEKGSGRGHGSSASSGGGGNNNQQNVLIEHAAVIITAKSRRGGSAPSSSSSVVRESNAIAKKPKKAPLMQKTLKSMKTLMRR